MSKSIQVTKYEIDDGCQHLSTDESGICLWCGLQVYGMELATPDCSSKIQFVLEDYLSFIKGLTSIPDWLKQKSLSYMEESVDHFPQYKAENAYRFVYILIRRVADQSAKIDGEPFCQRLLENEIFSSRRKSINQARQCYETSSIEVATPIEYIPQICSIEGTLEYKEPILQLIRTIISKDKYKFFLELEPRYSAIGIYRIYASLNKINIKKDFCIRHSITEGILKNITNKIIKIIKDLDLCP